MNTTTQTKQHFTSLLELFKATEGHQLTGQEVINERTYLAGEWQDISISPELRKEVCSLIAETLGGRQRTKDNVYYNLLNGRPQHWGLSRIFFNEHNGKVYCSYCAGQDYPYELNLIRTAIK